MVCRYLYVKHGHSKDTHSQSKCNSLLWIRTSFRAWSWHNVATRAPAICKNNALNCHDVLLISLKYPPPPPPISSTCCAAVFRYSIQKIVLILDSLSEISPLFTKFWLVCLRSVFVMFVLFAKMLQNYASNRCCWEQIWPSIRYPVNPHPGPHYCAHW